jgi:plastocyanin
MTSRSRLVALSGAIVVSLALPAAATAVTKQVYEGLPPKPQKKFIDPKLNTDAIDFFPHVSTIHVGDSIKFSATAFHNVDIPAKGKKPVDLLVTTGTNVTGSNDVAGAPYWFNGLPNFGFNPNLINGTPPVNYDPFKTAKGKASTFTYTGKKGVATPIPFGDNPKPLIVKFTKAGTVKYYCDLHPGMEGTVNVLPKTKKIPSAKADAKALQAQIDRDFKIAKGLLAQKPPANTINVGQAGKFGVEYFSFFPGKTTVPVGTTIKFQITPLSYESHTATTGPGGPIDNPTSYLGVIAASFFSSQFVPEGIYPSDPFGTVGTLTPSSHGNGFWNSGALDNVKASPQPTSNLVTFTAPGTYEFYCMVHPQMHGTVVVQ